MASAKAPARTAVVTGGSSGIGRAAAVELVARGFEVFGTVRTEAEMGAADLPFTPVLLELESEASIAAAAARVGHAVAGRGLDGLVNNAGIALAGPLECLPIAEIRRQLEVNVVGQMAVTQAFLPLLRRARGRIVNVGSIAGRLAVPILGAYSAAKCALEALTDALRFELAPFGVFVSIVEPANVATPIWRKSIERLEALEAGLSPELRRLYGPLFKAGLAFAEEQIRTATPPEAVARRVGHALTARRPKTRYLVGGNARMQAAVAKLVPDRLRDRLVAGFTKLPRKAARDEGSP